MIRTITRPSTANCTLPLYIGFLISDPVSMSCRRMATVMNVSHDSVNRFLLRENYTAFDLFQESSKQVNLTGGVLSVDDSVLDKPYANYIAYTGHFYSGKHHAVVKGINLITLYYTDISGHHLPISYRVYDKSEKKTKNDYFLEMLEEVLAWGVKPAWVTGDSWYSCVNNLKAVKKHGLGFQFALESNRLVSVEKGKWVQVQSLEVPENGLVVWLRKFGYVKVFRAHLKNQVRHYGVYLSKENNVDDVERLAIFSHHQFEQLHDQHWQIEQYHRTVKQVCHIESFQVRDKTAVRNHIFSAIMGYVKLQKMRATDVIKNCYQLQRDLFKQVVSAFVTTLEVTH